MELLPGIPSVLLEKENVMEAHRLNVNIRVNGTFPRVAGSLWY